jgi:hypothetical protein
MGRFERLQRKAEAKINKVATKVLGPALRKMPPVQLANLLRVQMRMYGVDACRAQVIKGIEQVFEENLEQNPKLTVDELVKGYMTGDESLPELLAVQKELGLEESHIRALAKEAKGGKAS